MNEPTDCCCQIPATHHWDHYRRSTHICRRNYIEGIREAVTLYQNTNLKERLQKYHGNKTDALFDAWTKTWLSDVFRTWNIEHCLPQIKCPVLVIQGDKDEFGSEEQVNGIINRISGKATKLIIPGIGHTPHREARKIVLSHSATFINNHITN